MEMSPEYDGTQAALDDFQVSLEVFEGPFDLLLQLISRKKLDITQVALAEVTDEFIAHMRAFPDLSRTSEFLVVAATLLDMKAARLLPDYEEESSLSSEDLEARDLLFSRLLQYRAFKLASGQIAQQLEAYVGLIPRSVALEPQFTRLLPELRWEVGAEDLAQRPATDCRGYAPPFSCGPGRSGSEGRDRIPKRSWPCNLFSAHLGRARYGCCCLAFPRYLRVVQAPSY